MLEESKQEEEMLLEKLFKAEHANKESEVSLYLFIYLLFRFFVTLFSSNFMANYTLNLYR